MSEKQVKILIITYRIISVVLVILWLRFIFGNSAEPAEVSSIRSGRITEVLGYMFSEKVIRKTAHVIEYTVLGILLKNVFYAFNTNKAPGTVITPLAIGLATGFIDETIQLTSEGRSAQISDVIIDFGGVVIGVMIVWYILKQIKRKEKNTDI